MDMKIKGINCPFKPDIIITSYYCKKCEHNKGVIMHSDEHGRLEYYTVNCPKLDENDGENEKKTLKEEILENKFKEYGIQKGWVDESKQAVLDAMEEYANKYKKEITENPQYEDDGKIDGDTVK